MMALKYLCISVCVFAFSSPASARIVTTVDELVVAVRDAAAGDTIALAAGTFELTQTLVLPAGTTLVGAGIDATTLTAAESWRPSTRSLPDPEMKKQGLDTDAYLIRVADGADDVSISGMTLTGPRLHGAVFGWSNQRLHLSGLRIEDFLWSGIRTFAMQDATIIDCQFIDAGGRWKRGGEPGTNGGITGGAIFAIWMKDTEIAHNRFVRTNDAKDREFYGIKVRQGKRCRLHHNTIGVNFSIEFPFENDEDVEIDHNVCDGTISIPKHGGGPVPESGRTFHIHHNLLRNSYAIEFVRNGVEIDHNRFDFRVDRDHGNLISGFGKVGGRGPMLMHNNLIRNPGRGIVWMNEPYANLVFRNNHVVANTTKTPRTEGLFGLRDDSDFATIEISSNVIECVGTARPLLRSEAMAAATIRNNLLTNVADVGDYENVMTGESAGLESPLRFQCGVHGEVFVDGWE